MFLYIKKKLVAVLAVGWPKKKKIVSSAILDTLNLHKMAGKKIIEIGRRFPEAHGALRFRGVSEWRGWNFVSRPSRFGAGSLERGNYVRLCF